MSEAFLLAIALFELRGVDVAGKVGSVTVDDTWSITINGTDKPADEIPRYHASVSYKGFPAGVFSPNGGIVCAGECANEGTLIAALKAAIGENMPLWLVESYAEAAGAGT